MSWAADLQSPWHYFVGQYFKRKRILDVGAGQGKSRERLDRGDNIVTTQDIDRSLMDTVNTIKPIEFLIEEKERWDIVTAFDVIEHVYDARDFVLKIYSLSTEGIFLTTPNYEMHPRPWHFKADEFVDFFDCLPDNKIFKYFMRNKTSESDDIEEIDKEEFLNNKEIYAFGLYIYRKS